MSDKRLSGNQIVVMVVAFCAAVALAPAGVYAATVTKVRLLDAKSTRAAHINTSGRLLTDTTGSVTQLPPKEPLHREGASACASSAFIGAPIPKGKNIAIGSVHALSTGCGGWTQVVLKKASAAGGCTPAGATLKVVANFTLGSTGDAAAEFPVPLIQTRTDTAICIQVVAASDVQVIVDGYTY
jgi:hypothetical protein